MKRNMQPTVMATIGKELGELVQHQPRALIMWTRNGLGTLFEAMKAFPKSTEIAENVWATMEHIRDEALSQTDTAIELHGSHLHIMKKSLRRMKKHPDVEKWRTLYEVLEANNQRKRRRSSHGRGTASPWAFFVRRCSCAGLRWVRGAVVR